MITIVAKRAAEYNGAVMAEMDAALHSAWVKVAHAFSLRLIMSMISGT
jgi:hypothetical protein